MLSSSLLLALALASTHIQSVTAILPAGYRGVNIGGWMVLESWIRPSLFNNNSVPGGVGEFQFCSVVGAGETCCNVLEPHWGSWLTSDDFSSFAAAGITHVRIPLGYWILGNLTNGEPFCTSGLPYLLQALVWAKNNNIKAIFDLHGAPGSQNGHDNSGSSAGIYWNTPYNQSRTTDYLVQFAALASAINQNASTLDVVDGIELLNEPWTVDIGGPITMSDLHDWYITTITAMRPLWQGDIWISDGWNIHWSGWEDIAAMPNIVVDTHRYQCFAGPSSTLSPWGHVTYACDGDGADIRNASSSLWNSSMIVVGEYSLCLQGDVSPAYPFGQEDIIFYHTYGVAQMKAYGSLGGAVPGLGGSFFWCHRTESSQSWSFLQGISEGYLPQSLLKTNASMSSYECDAAM